MHPAYSVIFFTTATGAGPFYRVDFAYSARPANDVPSGYLAGNPVREPYQLDRISIQDAAGYTMVKKNWFNGVKMPAIAIRELDGSIRTVREFDYADYEASLS